MIIAVDFDGTLCEKAKFPAIGMANTKLITSLRERQGQGDKLILWTCRTDQWLDDAIRWCKEQLLEFDAINDDVRSVKATYFGRNKSKKVYAHIYIDDVNWPIHLAELGVFPSEDGRNPIATKAQAHGQV